MAEYVDVDNLSKEELKDYIRELDSGESVWTLCKKRLYEDFNYTTDQISRISKEGSENQ